MTNRYAFRTRQANQQPKRNKRTRNDATGRILDNPGETQETESMFVNVPKKKRSSSSIITQEAPLPENTLPIVEVVSEQAIISEPVPPPTAVSFKEDQLSLVISRLKEAKDAAEMNYLAATAFDYFESFGPRYTSSYQVGVYSFIHHRREIESLEKQKPCDAYVTKSVHDQRMAEVSNLNKHKSTLDRKEEEVQNCSEANTARINHLEQELKELKEKKVKYDALLADIQAEIIVCDKAHHEATLKLNQTRPGWQEASAVIDDWERQYYAAVDGFNRAKDELSHLKM